MAGVKQSSIDRALEAMDSMERGRPYSLRVEGQRTSPDSI
jgi:hypothetical protein